MKQKTFLLLACLICAITSYAQIGYQVSLLNSATGEPRSNETVSVSVEITNSENTHIFSSTQSATTNDFGVISLQIGNSTTFDNVDWSKLPLFISATVDGVMIGKSQILSVPLAEALRPADLVGTWSSQTNNFSQVLTLNSDASFYLYTSSDKTGSASATGIYFIQGNLLCLCCSNYGGGNTAGSYSMILMYNQGSLYPTSVTGLIPYKLSKN